MADEFVAKAVSGEMSPKKALDQAAAEWEKLTDRLGREQQIAYYRASLNVSK